LAIIRSYILAFCFIGPTLFALVDSTSSLTEVFLLTTVFLTLFSMLHKLNQKKGLLGISIVLFFFIAIFLSSAVSGYAIEDYYIFTPIIPSILYGFFFKIDELEKISHSLIKGGPLIILFLLPLSLSVTDETYYSMGEYGYYSLGVLGSFAGVLSLLRFSNSIKPQKVAFFMYLVFFVVTLISAHRTSILNLILCSSYIMINRFGLFRLSLAILLMVSFSSIVVISQLVNVDLVFSRVSGIDATDFDDYSSGRGGIWADAFSNFTSSNLLNLNPVQAYFEAGGMHSIMLDLILGFGILGFLIGMWFYRGVFSIQRRCNALGVLILFGAFNITLTGWYIIATEFWLIFGILICSNLSRIKQLRNVINA
jgi:hypothetical protein